MPDADVKISRERMDAEMASLAEDIRRAGQKGRRRARSIERAFAGIRNRLSRIEGQTGCLPA